MLEDFFYFLFFFLWLFYLVKFSSAEKINRGLKKLFGAKNEVIKNIASIGYYLAILILFMLSLGRCIDFIIKFFDYLNRGL